MIRKTLSIVLVLVWMSLIFYMSNANGEQSGNLSRTIIVKVVETFTDYREPNPEIDRIVDKYEIFVRKGAHFFEYAILAFLVMNMLFIFEVKSKTLLISATICILYAISDELHQYFISERSGNVVDVMWDSSASLITSYVFYKLILVRNKHERKSK